MQEVSTQVECHLSPPDADNLKQTTKGKHMTENTNIEELKAPLLAALGAADLALATVNELITNLRDRAEETVRTPAAASRRAVLA